MNLKFLFLHDTPLKKETGAEYHIIQQLRLAHTMGINVEFKLLRNPDELYGLILDYDFLVMGSSIRCNFENQLYQFLFENQINYVKVEYDYNFCQKRNIICTENRSVRNCCDRNRFQLFREIFKNSISTYFITSTQLENHIDFYGDVLDNAKILFSNNPFESIESIEESKNLKNKNSDYCQKSNYITEQDKYTKDLELFWSHILNYNKSSQSIDVIKKDKVLVYKSYGGLGDIFFTFPALLQLKSLYQTVTLVVKDRQYAFFKKYSQEIEIISVSEAIKTESDYSEIIELGNYPHFKSEEKLRYEEIHYITNKKLKQHSIEHYKDGLLRLNKNLIRYRGKFPYFPQSSSKTPYYTLHAGAGFLLKAWPVDYYAELIEKIHSFFPHLKCYIIQGPNDPNPKSLLLGDTSYIDVETGGLEAVGDVVSGALFHIGNDAGITHLAGAFNIPTLAIYGPTGPGSWGPFSEKNKIIWGKKNNCQIRCNYEVIINCENRVCLTKIQPRHMFYELTKLLSTLNTEASTNYVINPNVKISNNKKSFIISIDIKEYLIESKNQEVEELFKKIMNSETFNVDNLSMEILEIIHILNEADIIHSIPKAFFTKEYSNQSN